MALCCSEEDEEDLLLASAGSQALSDRPLAYEETTFLDESLVNDMFMSMPEKRNRRGVGNGADENRQRSWDENTNSEVKHGKGDAVLDSGRSITAGERWDAMLKATQEASDDVRDRVAHDLLHSGIPLSKDALAQLHELRGCDSHASAISSVSAWRSPRPPPVACVAAVAVARFSPRLSPRPSPRPQPRALSFSTSSFSSVQGMDVRHPPIATVVPAHALQHSLSSVSINSAPHASSFNLMGQRTPSASPSAPRHRVPLATPPASPRVVPRSLSHQWPAVPVPRSLSRGPAGYDGRQVLGERHIQPPASPQLAYRSVSRATNASSAGCASNWASNVSTAATSTIGWQRSFSHNGGSPNSKAMMSATGTSTPRNMAQQGFGARFDPPLSPWSGCGTPTSATRYLGEPSGSGERLGGRMDSFFMVEDEEPASMTTTRTSSLAAGFMKASQPQSSQPTRRQLYLPPSSPSNATAATAVVAETRVMPQPRNPKPGQRPARPLSSRDRAIDSFDDVKELFWRPPQGARQLCDAARVQSFAVPAQLSRRNRQPPQATVVAECISITPRSAWQCH